MDRSIVLWCSNSSIEKRSVSVLAVLEIPLGMLIFGWLSCASPFPWWTLVGIMAAPMLLLRSPTSIQSGINALKRYHDGTNSPRPVYAYIASIVICAILFAAFVSYAVDMRFELRYVLYSMIFFILGVIVVSVFIDMQCMCVMKLINTKPEEQLSIVLLPVASFIFIGVIAGVVMRAMVIRFFCTFRYVLQGMSSFSQNYFETVLVVDFFHMPEILPGASSVATYFSFSKMLSSTLFRDNITVISRMKSLFIIIPAFVLMYVPVVLYRLNLKASIIIWGFIAYVLRPVKWIGEEDMRSKTSHRTTWVLQGLLGSALLVVGGWLLLPYFSNELNAILPDKLLKAYTVYPAPALGVRYVMLWALCFSLSGLLLSAYCIRSAHDKLLACAADLKGYAGEPLIKFEQQAAKVQRCLNATLAITVLTVWVFALWWALQRWPNELHNVVWTWIRPWL